MATVLVTGGAGYIGSVCVDQLISLGHKVVVIDNLSKGKKELVDEKAQLYEGDTTNKEFVSSVFSEHSIDTVIHFAAYKAVGESMENAVKYSANIIGLTTILNAMVEHKVGNIIFSSTAAVYGTPKYTPVDEKHPTHPESFYGASKLMGEELLSWYNKIHNIHYVALRYFNVIGDVKGYIDPDAQNVLPIIAEVVSGKRETFSIFGDDYDTRDGTGIRDYVDVTDLVSAHIKALEYKGEPVTINLGTEQGTTVKELVRAVENALGEKLPCTTLGRRAGDPSIVVATAKKASELLDWNAKIPLEQSIKATLKAYDIEMK